MAGGLAAPGHGAPLPVNAFYSSYSYPEAVLSPSGRYIAALYPENHAYNLVVIDTQGMTSVPVTHLKSPARVTGVGWDTDERLIYTMVAVSLDDYEMRDIAAVNRDGKNPLLLVDNQRRSAVVAHESLVDWTLDDPHSVLVSSDAGNEDFPAVYEVNTVAAWHALKSGAVGARSDPIQRGGVANDPANRTAASAQIPERPPTSRLVFPTRRTQLVSPPGRKCGYLTDSQGVVRVCVTSEVTGAHKVMYRANAKSGWLALAEYANPNSVLTPIGFAPDDRKLYVYSNRDRDTIALFEYDPEERKLGRLVFEAPGYDLADPLWSSDHRRLLGVSYGEARSVAHYFDAHAAQVQKDVQGLFPGDEVTIRNFSQDGKRAMVLVANERTPGTFYLYDEVKGAVEPITARAPWIDPKQMSEMKPITYPARDGLDIPGYLTLPRGKPPKNLPLIVFPHGGPYAVRDTAGFDPDVQFFASRGYAVVQMNFRGSGGYGTKFREAGAREWGGKMQDDVTDAVRWAVGEGVADANRVCIFGISYGGYAALMGAATTPELYKCAISYAGVSDLETMFQPRIVGSMGRRDRTPEELEFIARVIGNQRDAAWLRDRSPVAHAAQIRCPVFIAHGERDLVVPFSNALEMRRALQRQQKTVEFVSRIEEGHGFLRDVNRVELFTRIEAFLKKYNPAE